MSVRTTRASSNSLNGQAEVRPFVPKLGSRASVLCRLAHQLADMSRLAEEMYQAVESIERDHANTKISDRPTIANGVSAHVYLNWVGREAARRRDALQRQILDQDPSSVQDVLVLLQLATHTIEEEVGTDDDAPEKRAAVAALNASINWMIRDGAMNSPLGNDGAHAFSKSWSECLSTARREAARIARASGKLQEEEPHCRCFECNRAEDGGAL